MLKVKKEWQAEFNCLCRKYTGMNQKILRAQFINDKRQQAIELRKAYRAMGEVK